jgi:hypothetical protein
VIPARKASGDADSLEAPMPEDLRVECSWCHRALSGQDVPIVTRGYRYHAECWRAASQPCRACGRALLRASDVAIGRSGPLHRDCLDPALTR